MTSPLPPRTITPHLVLPDAVLAWLDKEADRLSLTRPEYITSLLVNLHLWRTATDSGTVLARLRAIQPWVEALGGVIVHRNPIVSRELESTRTSTSTGTKKEENDR